MTIPSGLTRQADGQRSLQRGQTQCLSEPGQALAADEKATLGGQNMTANGSSVRSLSLIGQLYEKRHGTRLHRFAGAQTEVLQAPSLANHRATDMPYHWLRSTRPASPL